MSCVKVARQNHLYWRTCWQICFMKNGLEFMEFCMNFDQSFNFSGLDPTFLNRWLLVWIRKLWLLIFATWITLVAFRILKTLLLLELDLYNFMEFAKPFGKRIWFDRKLLNELKIVKSVFIVAGFGFIIWSNGSSAVVRFGSRCFERLGRNCLDDHER